MLLKSLIRLGMSRCRSRAQLVATGGSRVPRKAHRGEGHKAALTIKHSEGK
jgi:hypothetical protein